MSERPKVPPQIVHDSDVLAEAENAIDGVNKLSLCVEWLMRETLLHLGAHDKRTIQIQNVEPSRYCAICSNKECDFSGTERTTTTCEWSPPEPQEPGKVYPFDCGNCGNGKDGTCPLALSECSGQNDFAKWVRPLTKTPEPD